MGYANTPAPVARANWGWLPLSILGRSNAAGAAIAGQPRATNFRLRGNWEYCNSFHRLIWQKPLALMPDPSRFARELFERPANGCSPMDMAD